MFTWICPKCGSEVPPAYSECPTCVAASKQPTPVSTPIEAAPAASTRPAPLREPQPDSPPVPRPDPRHDPRLAPAPEVHVPTPVHAPSAPARRNIQSGGWLLFLLGIALGGALAYAIVSASDRGKPVAADPTALQRVGGPGSSGPRHPLAKHIEVTGLRIIEAAKGNLKLQFLVVNHSPAELPEMKMQINVRAADRTVVEIPAALPSLGPYEFKELTSTVKTNLQPYELPDWQLMKPEFTLTAQQ